MLPHWVAIPRLCGFTAILVSLLHCDATLHAALAFRFETIDSATHDFASRGWLNDDSLFQRNVRAAAKAWGETIDAEATLSVRIDASSFMVRAGGSYSYGRFLRADTDRRNVWEPGPLSKVLTGVNPGEAVYGYDMLLGFDPSFVDLAYWLDPAPETRTAPVDALRGDFISVVMHEMGHALGMAGNRSYQLGPTYGDFDASDKSLFDSMTNYLGNGRPLDATGQPQPLVFKGASTAQLLGHPLPITHVPSSDFRATQNFYHLGQGCVDVPELTTSLMNACTIPNGERLAITPIDRALFADLGYPMTTPLVGDFDGNGALDAKDIDVLFAAMQQPAPAAFYDLNHDASVNDADLAQWLVSLKHTWRGDANLDGEFNSGDLVHVFQAGQFESPSKSSWASGDWNGDGLFDSSDFVSAFADGGFEIGPRPAIFVPEPASNWLIGGVFSIAILAVLRGTLR